MTGYFVVFRRALADRARTVAVLSTLPLLAILAVAAMRPGPGEVVALWTSFMLLGVVVAPLVVGMTLDGGPSPFYLNRPLTPLQMLAGQLGAGFVLTLGAQLALVVVPTLVLPSYATRAVHEVPIWMVDIDGNAIASVLLGDAALLIAGLGAAVAIRSRSAWVVLDVAGATAVAVTACAMDDRLAILLEVLIVVVVGSGLIVAFTTGRADPRRSHRLLSAMSWPIILPACAVFAVLFRLL